MKKTVNEEDFLYANKNAFRKTEVNGNTYYYFFCPNGGKKIYGKSPEELKERIIDLTDTIKGLLDYATLKEAMLIWNKYVRYAPPQDKEKFELLIDLIDKRMSADRIVDVLNLKYSRSEFESKYFKPVPIEQDLSHITGYLYSDTMPSIFQYFVNCMYKFIDFAKWTGHTIDGYYENSVKEITSKERKNIMPRFYLSDLQRIENQLNVYKKENNPGYYVLLISLHTGMFAADIYKMKWKDIDFDNKTIGNHKCKMDDIVYSNLLDLKCFKDRSKQQSDFLFPAAENSKSYTNILSFYETVKRNTVLINDISIRDITLIKGKDMLNKGKNPLTVANMLGISLGGPLYKKIYEIIVKDDIENNKERKNVKERKYELKDLMSFLVDFPEDKISDLIQYGEKLKKSGLILDLQEMDR